MFIQTPWQAVIIYASSRLQQQTRTQMYLNTTWPQAVLCRPIYAKGHLSFRDTYPDSYSCLSVLCVLYVLYPAACLAAVCTMQCLAASNAYYTASHVEYIIFILFFEHFLKKLYSIVRYLGHRANFFDFYTL